MMVALDTIRSALGSEESRPEYRTAKLLRDYDVEPGCHEDEQELCRTFVWNNKKCRGNVLHEAVRNRDFQAVYDLLERFPQLVSSRFSYQTVSPDGASQDGTGEAIHIAAGGHEPDLVTLLFHRHASIHSKVTRGQQDHYAVLHAAVFAEGRGGCAEVVELLLSRKAEMEPNLNGQYPLHLAFQSGSLDIIGILRAERKSRKLRDIEMHDEGNSPTPLEVGIMSSGMTTRQLVDAARLAPDSLRVFSLREPKAIPLWLDRLVTSPDFVLPHQLEEHCMSLGGGSPLVCMAAYLAQLISVKELAVVLINCPAAADALLTAVTSSAQCRSPALHPAPRKVRMQSRYFLQRVLGYFNPPIELLPTYQVDCVWEYDAQTFEAPAWHDFYVLPMSTAPSGSRSTMLRAKSYEADAEISCCYIPDLASAEFFVALGDGLSSVTENHEEHLNLFHNDVVKALISLVWWRGAVAVEFVNGLLDIWGLLLLLIDLWVIQKDAINGHGGFLTMGRELRSHHVDMQQSLPRGPCPQPLPFIVASDFLAARGVLVCIHEFHRMLAAWRLTDEVRACWFLAYVNKSRLITALACLCLWVDMSFISIELNHVVRLFVILAHWINLLTENLVIEPISKAMLPLTDTVRCLVPSLALTITLFVCYTHMRCYLMGELIPWIQVLNNSFLTLFVGDVHNTTMQWLDTALTYGGISVFSLFMLNIFIVVISENYLARARLSDVRYQQLLAGCCRDYLLRWRLAPSISFGVPVSTLLFVVSMFCMASIQVACIVTRYRLEHTWLIFLTCMGVMDVVAFLWKEHPWVKNTTQLTNNDHHFLWFARKTSLNFSPQTTIEHLRATVEELLVENSELRQRSGSKNLRPKASGRVPSAFNGGDRIGSGGSFPKSPDATPRPALGGGSSAKTFPFPPPASLR